MNALSLLLYFPRTVAGIGYFTLPYLVHAKAKHVHACEWNPRAVEALTQNLKLNGVSNRCTVYSGDNRQVRADRITCFASCNTFHLRLLLVSTCIYIYDRPYQCLF